MFKNNRFAIKKAEGTDRRAIRGKATDLFRDSELDDDEILLEAGSKSNIADEEYDPLDAFMSGITKQIEKEKALSDFKHEELPEIVSGEGDEEEYDHISSDEDDEDEPNSKTKKGASGGEDEKEKKRIEPLPPIDHSTINYPPFKKKFYVESREIAALTESAVQSMRQDLQIHVSLSASAAIASGFSDAPKPIQNFSQAGFDVKLLKEIQKAGFETPTPIQSQALPIAMSGFDIIGLAKTGSGKTFAYVWPMLVHILAQPQMELGDGPIGLVLVPTRELATQIYSEAHKFSKVHSIRPCAIYGGAGKWEMAKALKEAPEMVIATPGRFIEMVRSKATNLRRCTMVVLDEADRMFEMGFEYQMRSIVNNIRPDRQTLLFSATMKKKIEGFAREILSNEIRIVIGTIGQANPDIHQVAEVLPDTLAKWGWLSARIDDFAAEGKVLIFVLSKAGVEELTQSLKSFFATRQLDVEVDCLHGDKDQSERSAVMQRFGNKGSTRCLVATDIASRGLDVKDIRTVINYDVAKNIDTYVHRIGRTGRMGVDGVVPGTAFTLLTPADSSFAVDLVQNLLLSKQPVHADLQRLAEKDPKWGFVKGRKGGGGGGGGAWEGGSGRGIGKAGLGSGGSSKAMTSEMMAREAKEKGMGAEISLPAKSFGSSFASSHAESVSADYKANPYIEGRSIGRGKHLTQPSWTQSENDSAAVPSSVNTAQFQDDPGNPNPPPSSSSGVTGKRKSRFSAPAPAPTQSSVSAGPVLKGFIRSSAAVLSMAQNVNNVDTNNASDLDGKKSKWDY